MSPSLEDALADMWEHEEGPLSLELVAAHIRRSYALGYSEALEAPDPDLTAARERERGAWANLPVL